MAKKKRKTKKAKRHVVPRTRRAKAKRTRARGRTVSHARRTSRISSLALPIAREVARAVRKRVKRRPVRNPAHEFVVEAYKPKGHKFFYYLSDERLTTTRSDAARFRDQIHAMAKAKYIRDRVPRGIEWVRVCPA